jgi:hypothetical protein
MPERVEIADNIMENRLDARKGSGKLTRLRDARNFLLIFNAKRSAQPVNRRHGFYEPS